MIRLQDLYTFVVVARAGSMKQAATILGVTAGAVWQSPVPSLYGLGVVLLGVLVFGCMRGGRGMPAKSSA